MPDKPFKTQGTLHIKAGTSLREATYLIFRNLAKSKSPAERVEIAREVARISVEETAKRRAKTGPVSTAEVEELAQRILADNPVEN